MNEQRSIFSLTQPQAPEPAPGDQKWVMPKELPDLLHYQRLSLDTECDGKNPFKNKPIGVSLGYREGNRVKTYYIPFGHEVGPNFDPEMVKRWLRAEFVGKEVSFCNAKFDLHMLRNGMGVDLEEIGVKPRDVAFNAALLDDNRRAGLDLATLALQFTNTRKLEFQGDMNKMAQYPAWMVGPYAERDALATFLVEEGTAPRIKQENLEEVLSVENDLIWFVLEIERNGCRVDVPKLELWRKEVRDLYEKCIWGIHAQTGLLVQPGSGESMRKLFKTLRIEPPPITDLKKKKEYDKLSPDDQDEIQARRTFTDEDLLFLKHPVTDEVVRARRLEGLLGGFLDKFHDGLIEGDLLRSQYHQLKGDKYGTVSGRFSSSGGGDEAYSFNAQQTIKPDLQIETLGDHHIVRELFIPDEGMEYWGCDASQIEYRLFGHFSNCERIIKAYREDPTTDYHRLVQKMLEPFRPGIKRGIVKNVNFSKLYRAQVPTFAATAGITIAEGEKLYAEMGKIFPEADTLSESIEQECKTRGYVTTLLGRRARLKDRFHSATNRVIQGSAADIMKLKLRHVYNERKTLGITKLRMMIHDEQTGDKLPGEEYTKRMRECFNEQELELRVPITWELATGQNWRECK